MGNEWLWVMLALVNFILLVASYKIFGKWGLVAWIVMGTLLANIQVMKTIELFGITATLGNIMFGSLFLATDALNEKYGPNQARRAVLIGLFTMVVALIVMQFAVWFEPSGSDQAHGALKTLFNMNWADISFMRIALASLTAYLISQLLDVSLFQWIKRRYKSTKTLFIRNLGSTMISQLVDSLIFVPIAFLGVFGMSVLIEIIITTYVIKMFVALLDTPFIYLIKWIKPLNMKP